MSKIRKSEILRLMVSEHALEWQTIQNLVKCFWLCKCFRSFNELFLKILEALVFACDAKT